MTDPSLPRLARVLVSWLVPADWRESIEGDLREERARRAARGRRGAFWMLPIIVMTGLRLSLERRALRRQVPGPSTRKSHVADGLASDVRQSLRSLRANPGFALTSIAVLAIGIGANDAIFNLANWMLFRPVAGVRDVNRLVTVRLGIDNGGSYLVSVADVQTLATSVPALSPLAGYQDVSVHFAATGGVARRLDGEVVSGPYFDVLGGALQMGRGFTPAEGRDTSLPPVAVISDHLWRTDLGASRDVLSQTITVNRQSVRVVGVAVAGFRGTSRTGATDLWMPIAQHALLLFNYGRNVMTARTSGVFINLVGRLAPNTSAEVAVTQAEAVRTRLLAENPADRRLTRSRFLVRPGIESTPWVQDTLRGTLRILMGIVVLVLVLTCANVGNLMVARATSRASEVATRMALGASRFRVVRLLLVESLILSACAGVAALGLSVVAAWALEGTTVLANVPPLARANLDWWVVAFAFVVSTIVAVAAGVFPAFAGSRVDVGLALQREGRSQTGHRQRLRRVLSAVQVMLSMTLMIGAGLLARSMWARLSIDPGFDATRVMTFSVEPSLQRYGDRERPFYDDLVERVRGVPGVRAAAMSWIRPSFQPVGTDVVFRAEGAPETSKISADSNLVSPGFFDAIGLPIVEGREFSETEFRRAVEEKADQPVVMTESLARRTFGPGSAVGRRIVMSEGTVRTVVGVVRDTRQRRLIDPSTDLLFRPIGNTWDMWASIEVGLAADAAVVMPRVRAAVRDLDPTLPIYDVMRVDQAIRVQFAGEIFLMRLALVCAGLATLLAAVGLYGVLARGVTDRRRELGIRSALGASPAAVARLIAGEAVWIFAGGSAAGIAVSLWLGKYLESRLYGVTRLDIVSFGAALATLAIVTIVSTAPASRRAARTDPAAVLRG